MSRIQALILALAGSALLHAAGPELTLGRAVRDDGCALAAAVSAFRSEDAAAFVRIALRRPGKRVRVEWIDPAGTLAGEAEWAEVPAGACLISQLPLAGYAAGRKPGSWKVQARVDGGAGSERGFRVEGHDSGITISSVNARSVEGQLELVLTGSGFGAGSVVHVARFADSGGWQYLAADLPLKQTATDLTIRTRTLQPGEYIAVIRAADGSLSSPARFVIATGRAYRLPVPASEHWLITQGPHGAFSHWNRSEHAWDIAPLQGRYVLAMRAGVAHTHDLGMGQTPNVRSFGNYITIDHGDGEYSHYAHLATGRFIVRDGERVEPGQPIAVVGNSGYTLGPGGGYHVHVHVTRSPDIYAQSIPFRFNEDRAIAASPAGSAGTARGIAPAGPEHTGTVQVAQWWSELVDVPARTAAWDVQLAWEGAGNELDLHLMSPSGKHYGWYGITTGYSGQLSRPEEFKLPDPEPGTWRISVQGVRGAGDVAFQILSELKAKAPRVLSRNSGRLRF